MATQGAKDPKDPSTTSMAWDHMAPKWQMVETLLGGTEAMRSAGGDYLPQHAEESDANYNERLERTTLFNMIELTLESLVGKPFSDPLAVNDDVPQQLLDMMDDVNLQGDDVNTFARNWFRSGIAKGFAHVLVDSPVIRPEERANRTLADDRKDKVRPYWTFITPERLIFAAAEIVNGREVLTHVRIAEDRVEQEGFAEKVTPRIRVLEPGTFAIYEFVKERRKKGEWKLVDSGETGLDFIPLATFYANRTGFMTAKPPLEDLGHLNVRHWQSTSDQINVLTVARFPMLAVSGATDQTGSVMAIGPKQLLGTKDPNGKFYYVEHTGKAISAGRQDLQDLEDMMASYGAQFLRRKPGNATATARAIDSAESMSMLQDMSNRFVDAMKQALDMTAAWYRLDAGGTVRVRAHFGPDKATAERLNALLTARYGDNKRPGDLSREDFLHELKELGILSDEFEPAENLMRLMNEAAAAGLDTSRVDPADFQRNPSTPDDDEDEDD